MADPISIALIAGSTLLSVGSQVKAGKTAAAEAEITARTQEVAGTQREADRKNRLAEALATANAQSAAAGIKSFEGSPLTILQEGIKSEETATERDAFNTRLSALTTRSRGQSAKSQSKISALSSLLKGGSNTLELL